MITLDPEKYECEVCGYGISEEDFIALSGKDIWLCEECRKSAIPFLVEEE